MGRHRPHLTEKLVTPTLIASLAYSSAPQLRLRFALSLPILIKCSLPLISLLVDFVRHLQIIVLLARELAPDALRFLIQGQQRLPYLLIYIIQRGNLPNIRQLAHFLQIIAAA